MTLLPPARHTLVCFAILLSLAARATDTAAAVLNVSTSAQLEAAVAAAQPGDTIVLAPTVFKPSATLSIMVPLTIKGNPSSPSIIDGSGHDIFFVGADGVRIETLTLRNGNMAIIAGVLGTTLQIRGVTITGNRLLGVTTADGGGQVIIENSTIAGNVSASSLDERAIGIAGSCGSITLRHSTVARNDLGVFLGFPCDGDVFTVQNTLIASNGQDCELRGNWTLNGGASFDSDGTCRNGAASGASIFFTVFSHGAGFLADNGGPTATIALAANSPAVNAGTGCTLTFDQRGAFRESACDIGAFERSTAVRITSSTGAGTVDIATPDGTFRNFDPVAEAAMPNQAGKPAGVSFPFGFFQWSIELFAGRSAADVSFFFPAAAPSPPQYWKVVNGAWTNVCLHTTCTISGGRLTVTFVDGGVGDLDGIANGVIADPGGLGSGGETASFATCLLYDPAKAKKSGSTYPIRLQLCDLDGTNVSSPSIVLHAMGITQTSANAAGPLDDSGNANPDFTFRYDAALGGYIFNLQTNGLTTGTYTLNFTAGSDPTVYSVPFTVR